MMQLSHIRSFGLLVHKSLLVEPSGITATIWDVLNGLALEISSLILTQVVLIPWLDINYTHSKDIASLLADISLAVLTAIIILLIVIWRGTRYLPKNYYVSILSLLSVPVSLLFSYFYWVSISPAHTTFSKYFSDENAIPN